VRSPDPAEAHDLPAVEARGDEHQHVRVRGCAHPEPVEAEEPRSEAQPDLAATAARMPGERVPGQQGRSATAGDLDVAGTAPSCAPGARPPRSSGLPKRVGRRQLGGRAQTKASRSRDRRRA